MFVEKKKNEVKIINHVEVCEVGILLTWLKAPLNLTEAEVKLCCTLTLLLCLSLAACEPQAQCTLLSSTPLRVLFHNSCIFPEGTKSQRRAPIQVSASTQNSLSSLAI